MLSVDPILERMLRTSGAVPGRVVVLEVVVVVVVEGVALVARGTGGFFSAVPEVEDVVAGFAAVVRVREAAVVETELRAVVVVVFGFAESAKR